MCDDGQSTYFAFGPDEDLPAIFAVDPDGGEAVVNSHMFDGYIVVDRIAPGFVLRRGSEVTKVYNDGWHAPDGQRARAEGPAGKTLVASMTPKNPKPPKTPQDLEALSAVFMRDAAQRPQVSQPSSPWTLVAGRRRGGGARASWSSPRLSSARSAHASAAAVKQASGAPPAAWQAGVNALAQQSASPPPPVPCRSRPRRSRYHARAQAGRSRPVRAALARAGRRRRPFRGRAPGARRAPRPVPPQRRWRRAHRAPTAPRPRNASPPASQAPRPTPPTRPRCATSAASCRRASSSPPCWKPPSTATCRARSAPWSAAMCRLRRQPGADPARLQADRSVQVRPPPSARPRAFVVWSRIITPSGVSIDVGSPATDRLGRGGLEGKADTHFFERFRLGDPASRWFPAASTPWRAAAATTPPW